MSFFRVTEDTSLLARLINSKKAFFGRLIEIVTEIKVNYIAVESLVNKLS